MVKRRRLAHPFTLEQRLVKEAGRLREEAENASPGSPRDDLLRKACQTETAAHMTEWLTSSGLRPPK
jgi:hypothetical protein